MASSEGARFRFDEEPLCGGGYGGLVMEELGEHEGLIYGSAMEVAGLRASGMCGSESSSTTSSSGGGPSASWRAESGEAGIEQKRRASSFISGCLPESGDHEKQAVVSKKARTQSCSTLKVRKEKLSDRITALQQLVSPFGKTDTASVLHEAMGYIKFLHDQVQVLSSPYLQRMPSVQRPEGALDGEEPRYDLRSRGLCLVPVSSTVHVASSNGADFWAPAVARNGTNSSKVMCQCLEKQSMVQIDSIHQYPWQNSLVLLLML